MGVLQTESTPNVPLDWQGTGYSAMNRLPQLQAAHTNSSARTKRAQGKYDVSHVLAFPQLQALVGADLLVLQQQKHKGGDAKVQQGKAG